MSQAAESLKSCVWDHETVQGTHADSFAAGEVVYITQTSPSVSRVCKCPVASVCEGRKVHALSVEEGSVGMTSRA